jgi:hypothetical protein
MSGCSSHADRRSPQNPNNSDLARALHLIPRWRDCAHEPELTHVHAQVKGSRMSGLARTLSSLAFVASAGVSVVACSSEGPLDSGASTDGDPNAITWDCDSAMREYEEQAKSARSCSPDAAEPVCGVEVELLCCSLTVNSQEAADAVLAALSRVNDLCVGGEGCLEIPCPPLRPGECIRDEGQDTGTCQ